MRWEIIPDFDDIERLGYDKHVTSDCHNTRIIQTCDWMIMLIAEFRSYFGPANPPTLFVFLNRLLPDWRTSGYCSQWVVRSDEARNVVTARYNEADDETKAALREEGKDQLNLEEHERLPFTALLEALFELDWKSQLRAAIVSTSAGFFGDTDVYQRIMDKYRLFLEE